MKKLFIFVFIFVLLFSNIALADGGIPLIVLLGSNLFITSSVIPPFVFGLLLFGLVCIIERWYLVKKLNIREKVTRFVVVANIYSTLWGIPLSVGLFFIQNFLCILFPYSMEDGAALCGLIGPLWISPIVDIVLLGLMSWFVEYKYLKKRLNCQKLKGIIALANLYSYLGMFIFLLLIGTLLSFSYTRREQEYLKNLESCETSCHRYASRNDLNLKSWAQGKYAWCKCNVCDEDGKCEMNDIIRDH